MLPKFGAAFDWLFASKVAANNGPSLFGGSTNGPGFSPSRICVDNKILKCKDVIEHEKRNTFKKIWSVPNEMNSKKSLPCWSSPTCSSPKCHDSVRLVPCPRRSRRCRRTMRVWYPCTTSRCHGFWTFYVWLSQIILKKYPKIHNFFSWNDPKIEFTTWEIIVSRFKNDCNCRENENKKTTKMWRLTCNLTSNYFRSINVVLWNVHLMWTVKIANCKLKIMLCPN